jgi:CO dehydrogenase/acetyl-CoA synthase beta subunit
MSTFNEHINKVHEYLQGREAKEFDCSSAMDELREGMPVQVGPGANPGIILRSDTYAELGNPAEGSTGFIVWTEDTSLVRDGRIALIGPDIPDLEGASVPFGQVIMLAGKNLNTELQEKIEEYQHISDHLEGYMVRSSSRNIWGRISKDAAAKGFTLQTLARALMITIKANVPEVEAMEIVFVTTNRDDIKQLDEIAGEVDSLRREIIKEYWKEKGYDLDCDLDCNSCNSKVTCDDIKNIIRARNQKERVEASESEEEIWLSSRLKTKI